jgi:hypothetical protein
MKNKNAFYVISIIFLTFLGFAVRQDRFFGDNYLDFRVFHILCFLYVTISAYYELRHHAKYVFVNPFFTTIFITYLINFGLFSNFIFLSDGDFFVADYDLGLTEDYKWYKIMLFNVALSAFGLILGYQSRLGFRLHDAIKRLISVFFSLSEKGQYAINNTAIIFGYIFTVVARYFLFRMGIFGRFRALNKDLVLADFYDYDQLLNLITPLATVCLFLYAYQHYRSGKRSSGILVAMMAVELVIGFFAGSRGSFLTPLFILMAANYFAVGSVRWIHLPLVLLGLYFSILIIVPFKTFYSKFDTNFDYTDPFDTVSKFYTFYADAVAYDDGDEADVKTNRAWYVTLFDNTNYSTEAAASIQFEEEGKESANRPDFVENLLLSPFYAVVPRILLPTKKSEKYGYWFREEVLEVNVGLEYSITFTPIGFLYFAGGSIGVFLGFFLMGIFQRSFTDFLFMGLPGVVIFLAMDSTIYYIDAAVDGTIINFIRNIFIAIMSVSFFVKRVK